jgi:Bacterial CdiA-CT RNAse A domain
VGTKNHSKACRWPWFVSLLAALVCLSGCGQAPAPASVPSAAEETAGSRPDTSPAAGGRYDLERDEQRGGHTLEKHVGRTDEQLRERLQRERISAASTWTDRETAEVTIGEALRAERGRVEGWMRRGFPRANLALHFDARRPIGRSLRRGEEQSVDATSAVIVLRADGPESFYVLTAYPEERE